MYNVKLAISHFRMSCMVSTHSEWVFLIAHCRPIYEIRVRCINMKKKRKREREKGNTLHLRLRKFRIRPRVRFALSYAHAVAAVSVTRDIS